MLVPEPAEAAEPHVDLLQGPGLHGVQPARTVRSDGGETVLSQHLQVLRDARLGDSELPLDDRRDRPGRLLAVGEQFQDPASHRITENVERVHGTDDISCALYKLVLI